MQSFVPKNRRPKFDLVFRVHDLNNVPLVSGTSLIKWHLPSSTSAEHRGKTPKYTIKDHKVVYDYEKSIQVRLVIGKDGHLQESIINFEVLQEYQSSGRSERITLGIIKLNLAEYVDTGQHDQTEGGSITRRYLMQESKINSTLKIEISMKHLEGDKNYTAPPLRTAPVFGGIAGIISTEAADAPEEGVHMPSLSSKSRENGELQDMYRRTLAASWSAQPGEPRADECIEDIFAGGDGWGSRTPKNDSSRAVTPTQSRMNIRDDSDDEHGGLSRDSSTSNLSSVFGRHRHKWSPSKHHSRKAASPSIFGSRDLKERHSASMLKPAGVSGRTSLEQQVRKMERAGGVNLGAKKRRHEIDEFDNPYKEDLRSWRIRGNVV
ncbi:N-terminal C2 in EEIG1 and EHBP1 proteins-domain-containing protein [Elsinoe ampelina]|uniref:N-terminal C2 in EEIG1 and EHBP1 proteins-domain-containing protein n=1 Tax=Elsinoe ampelina TaxID=302913 RepID=A0A6A6GEC2_9PEZI|nr:N-terminal C2 in EEIG1 and EHBP1 proteins-domain-containing protein [Elsinoe ampelina]